MYRPKTLTVGPLPGWPILKSTDTKRHIPEVVQSRQSTAISQMNMTTSWDAREFPATALWTGFGLMVFAQTSTLAITIQILTMTPPMELAMCGMEVLEVADLGRLSVAAKHPQKQ